MEPGLTRRSLLAGLLAVTAAGLSACEGSPGVTPTTPTSSFDPPDDAALAIWELTGGLTTAGMVALRPPRLVVYGDGDAIADATYRSRLDPEQLQALTDGLIADLSAPELQKKPTAAPTVLDAPITRLTVWSPSGTLTASADGLDENKELYPSQLRDARDRLAAVHKTVSATAQPYLAGRVRVVAVPALDTVSGSPGGSGGSSPSLAAWPTDVSLPAPDADGLRRADLDGDAARGAVRMLTRDLDQRGAWPTYRLTDGSIVRASWRYLLPSE